MKDRVQNIKNEALAQIMAAESSKELQDLQVTYLGRKGVLNKAIAEIPDLPAKERGSVGILVNEVKKIIQEALFDQRKKLGQKHAEKEWFDPTIPGKKPVVGHLHLLTQAIDEISTIFERIGFHRTRYPEVEWDWFTFEGLNMPKNHPARDEWETFFVEAEPHKKYGEMVLTTHTSSGQLREMERVGQPPIRMINIAKVYRRQQDASHFPMFHQFEGLVIDSGINITHLKGTLDYFAKAFFGPTRKIRIRPYHFQFTEPSFEVDITCGICKGKGCSVCKSGWLELGGAGMVHPQVLKNGGINPTKYTGFAFGWGVERALMMKESIGIPDLRLLYSPDLKYLRQF